MDRIDDNLRRLWILVRERADAAGSPPSPQTSSAVAAQGLVPESGPTHATAQGPAAEQASKEMLPIIPELIPTSLTEEQRSIPSISLAKAPMQVQSHSPTAPTPSELTHRLGRSLRNPSATDRNRSNAFEEPPRVEAAGILRRILRRLGF